MDAKDRATKPEKTAEPTAAAPDVVSAKIDALTPDPRNANKGTLRGLAALERSLREYGAGRSILIDKHGRVIAGNKTLERAADLGIDDVIIIKTDGKKLVAVQRVDVDLDTKQGRELALADNRVAEIDLDWDVQILRELVDEGVALSAFWNEDELSALVASDEDAPPEFQSFDEKLATEYCCPKCGYRWSGKPNAD